MQVLEDIRKTTAAVANDLRDLSHQLHPAMLEILGTGRRIAGAVRGVSSVPAGLRRSLSASISDADASPQAAMCLYRVLQESLMNIAKHSGSASAHVSP